MDLHEIKEGLAQARSVAMLNLCPCNVNPLLCLDYLFALGLVVSELNLIYHLSIVKYANKIFYEFTVSFASRILSGGNVRCPWYFLFAHAAWAPESPSR